MDITRAGSRPSRIASTEYFTGKAWADPLFAPEAPARVRSSSVTFEPGARTGWHVHPLGQALIVTAGFGRVQREGQPAQEIRPGDVVWIAPGEKHWHGASALTSMSHIAVSEHLDGVTVTWLGKVSEEEYQAAQ